MAATGANPRIEMEIGQGDESWGKITLELEAGRAPKTVENFMRYVDSGFFDGTIFHRVMENFMIQGGGHGADRKPKGKEHPPVENEAKSGLSNKRGTIAMARTSEPHSATSQFFINVKDNAFLDHPGSDGWGYCAFGSVVEGLEVVDRIRKTACKSGGEGSEPVNPPLIKSARRVKG